MTAGRAARGPAALAAGRAARGPAALTCGGDRQLCAARGPAALTAGRAARGPAALTAGRAVRGQEVRRAGARREGSPWEKVGDSSRELPRSAPAPEGGVRSHDGVILREVAAKRVGQSSAE